MRLDKKLWMSLRKRWMLATGRRFYVKRVGSLRLLLDMRNRVDRHVDVSSVYEKPQVEYFFASMKQHCSDRFIDIGAHWGYYSILFAADPEFASARIHAFEPDRYNRYQLYANLFMNALHERIQVHDVAVSEQEGELRFHHFDANNRGRSCVAEDGEVVVQTARLDNVLPMRDERPAIKIDVEGHELEVVAGMRDTLRDNHCLLQIESFEQNLPALESAMQELGYEKFHTVHTDHYFRRMD